MSYINLKKYYGFDLSADVPEHIILVLEGWRKTEHAANERDRYHRPLPLDWKLAQIMDPSRLPDELLIRKLTAQRLHQALLKLPDSQFRRVIARYYFNLTVTQIAQNEGVSKQSVHESIRRAKKKLKKFLIDP